MTLRDIGAWLASDVERIFNENILDWPIWSFFVINFIILPLSLRAFIYMIEDQRCSKSVGMKPMLGFGVASIATAGVGVELFITKILFRGGSWVITAMQIGYVIMFIIFTSAFLVEFGKWRDGRRINPDEE